MKNHIGKKIIILLAFFATVFVACKKEDIVNNTIETYLDKASFSFDSTTNTGRFGCFQLVFPIRFTLFDSSIITVNNDAEFREILKSYIENHKDHHADLDSMRPKIIFPFTVINEDGATLTIANQEEMRALRDSCDNPYFEGKRDCKGHADKRTPCFKLNFPITVLLPDSTTATAYSPEELKNIGKTYFQNNSAKIKHLPLVFPVTVTKKDGTTVSVSNIEELKALKKSCD